MPVRRSRCPRAEASVFVIVLLVKHRREFKKVVASNSAISLARFLRLTGLASSISAVTLPLSIYTFINTQRSSGVYYDYSWTVFHAFVSGLGLTELV